MSGGADGAPAAEAANQARDRLPGMCARKRRRRPSAWWILVALGPLGVAAWFSAETVDLDSGTALLDLLGSSVRDLGRLRWQFAVLVVALAVLHYLAAAIAARAAADLDLPLGETFLVQLAASAANRLTPAGLGGAALTARYFTRRGLDGPEAVGAVTALVVFGGVANLLILLGLVVLGSSLGLGGSAHEMAMLTRHITHLLGPGRSPWLWLAVAVLLALVLAMFFKRPDVAHRWRHALRPSQQLLRRPRALATVLLGAGSTTLILGFAFIATAQMLPVQQPTAGLGALLVAFMLGSAAGSAVPVPAGLGSSEAAYATVLTSFGVPISQAIEVVLIFRLVTFWAPAVVGIVATRYLFKRKAL